MTLAQVPNRSYVKAEQTPTLDLARIKSGIARFVLGYAESDISGTADKIETSQMKEVGDGESRHSENVVHMLTSVEEQLTTTHGNNNVKESEEHEKECCWVCCPSWCQSNPSTNSSYSKIQGSG
jgi:hypothetical protein